MIALTGFQQEANPIARNHFSIYKSGNIEQAHKRLSVIEEKSERLLQLMSALEMKVAA